MSVLDNVYSYFRRLFTVTGPTRVGAVASDAGENVDELDVLALSTAWACVRLVAGTIGSLPLDVYRPGPGGHAIVATDHPLYRLLHRAPNAEQTAMDFWEGAAASIELKGNAVALKKYSVSGNVVSLLPLAWDYLNVYRLNGTGPLRYDYKGDTYQAEDVLHIRGFGGSPEGGLSTIAMGVATFGMAKAINRAAARTFKNGIRNAGVLSSDKVLTPEQMDQAQARIEEKYAGAMNAGRPLLLNAGLKWESLTINPDDAQMLESRAFSVEEICRLFNVPPHMVGHTQNSTSWGTGLEQQTLGFQKFNLRARLKKIETALEQQLLTPEDIARGVSIAFNVEGLLRGDSKARSELYQTALMNGWMTINEVRSKEGLPPVEGGDIPRMQMQNVPITQAGTTPALPAS